MSRQRWCQGSGDGVRGLVSVACVRGSDGVVCPRLVTRKNVQLGLDRRRGDAVLSHLRRLYESNIRNRAGGLEDARNGRGRRAKEPLCHHHSRTGVGRCRTILADDDGCNRRLTREGPAKCRAALRHVAVAVVALDELCRGIKGVEAREALQRPGRHQNEVLGTLNNTGKGISQVTMIGPLHR